LENRKRYKEEMHKMAEANSAYSLRVVEETLSDIVRNKPVNIAMFASGLRILVV